MLSRILLALMVVYLLFVFIGERESLSVLKSRGLPTIAVLSEITGSTQIYGNFKYSIKGKVYRGSDIIGRGSGIVGDTYLIFYDPKNPIVHKVFFAYPLDSIKLENLKRDGFEIDDVW